MDQLTEKKSSDLKRLIINVTDIKYHYWIRDRIYEFNDYVQCIIIITIYN